ncbi:hypothetical protein J1N35_037800 [Gossypium stocksii]|uniref:Uncharacterized protein n=1 Tax=Gossypium stocksii TaxID=47602 RepID=A0A9D3UKG3_9ROSI|nr:hypothetical protein J1N35_037800 [Gossypium stocksii]
MVVFCLLEPVFSTNENVVGKSSTLQRFTAKVPKKLNTSPAKSWSSWPVSISNSSRLSLFAASLPRMLYVVFCQSLPQPHPAYQMVVLCGSVNGQLCRILLLSSFSCSVRNLQYVASQRGASIPGGATTACTDGFKFLNLAKSNPNVALGGLLCRPFLNETYMEIFHLKVQATIVHIVGLFEAV